MVGWPQRTLIGTFLRGLKEETAAEVKMFKPQEQREAIGIARMCDERLARKKHARNELPKPTAITKNAAASASTVKQMVGSPIKEKSWEEMQRRREKGLCFNCNECFTLGHKCRVPQVVSIENDNAWEEEEQEDHGHPANKQFSTPDKLEISLHALSGWSKQRMMRMLAIINKHPVTVSIDSWSTHNFLAEKVAQYLHLLMTTFTGLAVKVATGEQLACREKYERVEMRIKGVGFVVILYSLLLGLDVVQGVQWLEKLGLVLCDGKELSMQFQWGKLARTLCGQQTGPAKPVSIEALTWEVYSGGEKLALCIKLESVEEGLSIPRDIWALLQE